MNVLNKDMIIHFEFVSAVPLQLVGDPQLDFVPFCHHVPVRQFADDAVGQVSPWASPKETHGGRPKGFRLDSRVD